MSMGMETIGKLMDIQHLQHDLLSSSIARSMQAGSRNESWVISKEIDGASRSFEEDLQNFTLKSEKHIDLSPGSIRSTSDPFSFAIVDEGFFEVQGSNGPVYTRNGEFHLSTNHQLVDIYGRSVMGDGGPIQLNATGGELYLNSSGQLFQGGQFVGKLQLHKIDPKNLLSAAGGYIIDPASGASASLVESPKIIQKAREDSNVSIAGTMVQLIEMNRHHEAGHKLISAHDDRTNSVIRVFGKLA